MSKKFIILPTVAEKYSRSENPQNEGILVGRYGCKVIPLVFGYPSGKVWNLLNMSNGPDTKDRVYKTRNGRGIVYRQRDYVLGTGIRVLPSLKKQTT